MNRPNSSLDWVLSHWAHFTVFRFIFVYVLFCVWLYIACMCSIITWWGGPDGIEAWSLGPLLLSVLWHCCLGHLTRKTHPNMTYNVFSGTLNPTHSISFWSAETRIGPLHLQAGCRRRRLNLALVFGQPFVKWFAQYYRTIVLSCLSVCLVCNVGVLWSNGWTDQGVTWHACRPRPWPHCVRWGPIEIGLSPGDFVLYGDPALLP